MELSTQQRNVLLDLAYQAIVEYLKTRETPSTQPADPQLAQCAGAFVTLTHCDKLCGCVGHVQADMPLWWVVQHMAVSAAEFDSRFLPLTSGELDDLEIEISVLSPLQRIHTIEQIEVGTHGLLIAQGGRRGLLLPQVATEYGWDRAAFLEALCDKASLPPGSWRHDATLHAFTALVFGKHFHGGSPDFGGI